MLVQVALQRPASQILSLPHWLLRVHAAQTLSVQIGVGLLQEPQSSVTPQPSLIEPQVFPCAWHVVGVQPQLPGVPPPPQVWGAVQLPQVPSQPSGPHAFPPQSGTQAQARHVPPSQQPSWQAPQSTACPQLPVAGPQTRSPQVAAADSGTHPVGGGGVDRGRVHAPSRHRPEQHCVVTAARRPRHGRRPSWRRPHT